MCAISAYQLLIELEIWRFDIIDLAYTFRFVFKFCVIRIWRLRASEVAMLHTGTNFHKVKQQGIENARSPTASLVTPWE